VHAVAGLLEDDAALALHRLGRVERRPDGRPRPPGGDVPMLPDGAGPGVLGRFPVDDALQVRGGKAVAERVMIVTTDGSIRVSIC